VVRKPLAAVKVVDPTLKLDLDYYLKSQPSAKKKDARTFTFFAQGQGQRTIRLSYTLAAPVWKATYRILLGEEGKPPMIQGWAVVDNTQDEDWENVQLSLIAGLPVSFVHDLYTPRYIRRPEVKVQETTGVLPPEVEEGMVLALDEASAGYSVEEADEVKTLGGMASTRGGGSGAFTGASVRMAKSISSTPTQVRERKI